MTGAHLHELVTAAVAAYARGLPPVGYLGDVIVDEVLVRQLVEWDPDRVATLLLEVLDIVDGEADPGPGPVFRLRGVERAMAIQQRRGSGDGT